MHALGPFQRVSKYALKEVKPPADVTDFEKEFSSKLEKIWTQLRLGVIDTL
ncbi:hypothetical protein P9B03_03725 [Metasolibacillus meyeri]|uniref:Uncharacterized protein n=1 Tax=Metasolibacillus meyeri TaxID=1071052 RepID=A0AAW9NM53_9BACL|nr:hypothetical protein [Metasolibacillus meyeri]MEC1177582.1 hypothetical protein [Metasolibacillus meyeri]